MTWTCFYAFLLFVILVVVVDTVWQWVTEWKCFFLFDSFVKRTLQLLSNVACSHVFLWVKIEYWVEGIHLYYWHYKSTILNLPWKWNNLKKKRKKGRNFIWKIFDRIFLANISSNLFMAWMIVVASLMFVLCYAMLHKCTTGKNLK